MLQKTYFKDCERKGATVDTMDGLGCAQVQFDVQECKEDVH